jgi:hypothetical protein
MVGLEDLVCVECGYTRKLFEEGRIFGEDADGEALCVTCVTEQSMRRVTTSKTLAKIRAQQEAEKLPTVGHWHDADPRS